MTTPSPRAQIAMSFSIGCEVISPTRPVTPPTSIDVPPTRSTTFSSFISVVRSEVEPPAPMMASSLACNMRYSF